MERIKQALERARRDQSTASESQLLPPALNPQSQVEPNSAQQTIKYSQTKVVPLVLSDLKDNRIIAGSESDVANTAYKMLRTQVLQRMMAKGWNALAVTSPGPGDGKTLTAINLAISLAREVQHTVLLVDFDMRKPSIHEYFNFTPAKGITDFLLRETPVSEILVNPGIERLVLLPGRESVPNSSELLASPRMVKLVDELKSRYPSRFVLFDLPPLLSADDALAFSPYVDTVLMVINEGKTTKEELLHAMGMVGNTQVLGTVLNRSADRISTYY